ncbi:MAG: HAMP domain-containing histidine kinase [Lactobacillales bacterium]|jgi:two-component system sensor histidine kinase CiaH|nr:HAMP domain-containing histidine kinase [Lactobacillales bacterium]
MLDKLSRKQKIRFFIQQTIAFGGIFLLLTFIVLSIIRQTAYLEVDKRIVSISKNPQPFLENLAFEKFKNWFSSSSEEVDHSVEDLSTNIIFWTDKIPIFFVKDDIQVKTAFKKVKLKDLEQEKISQLSAKSYGVNLYFRYISVPVRIASDPSIRYMQVFSNVNQIRKSTEHSINIVIWCMLIFWLISLGVSFLLSHLFTRPILKSWKKQQEFVENASHELRTPLSVVQNNLELLFTQPEGKIIDHSKAIGDSLSEIRRLRRLTTDLLTLARSQIQIIEAKKEAVNIRKLIENLIKNYQLLGEKENKAVTLKVNRKFPQEIVTDAKLIQQLLIILLDNALKYTKTQESFKVVLESKIKEWSFTVKDLGSGIPDKKKSEIFERFTCIDSSRNRDSGGFGLGLSIAKQITQALNGKITVENNSPKGSVFQVILPK